MPKKKTDEREHKYTMEQLRGVVNMGRESEASMDQAVRFVVLVDPTCPRWLGEAVRDALMPERDAKVEVHELREAPAVVDTDSSVDIAVVLCGASADYIRGAIRYFCGARRHTIVVAESSLDVPQTLMPSKLGQFVTTVVASERGPLLDRLSAAILDSTEKDVSVAANFAFCREAATARLVSKCAARNALMGVADFIPGAGMPLMTMNQINLAFDVAATYGQGLSIARVPEVIFVVSAGVCYRGLARFLTAGMPAFGLVVRCGLAYAGTLMTGRILHTHFKEGQRDTIGEAEVPLMVEASVI